MATVAGGTLQNKPQPYASFAIKLSTGQRITFLQSHSDNTTKGDIVLICVFGSI